MGAQVIALDDKVSKAGDTMTGTLTFLGTPPLAVPAGSAAGYVLTSDVSGNAAWAPPPGANINGLQFVTTGGAVTTGMITAAQNAGFQGMFLDPRFVWDMSGLVLNGIQNFIFESRMVGSIGWTGNIAYNTGGFIKTGTSSQQDGIQVYASSPGGAGATQGVIFRNCVLVGSNSRAVVHFGGGQRRCGLVDTLVYNTRAAAGAYAVVIGSGLGTDNNSEDNIFCFTGGGGLAGNYAALGIGVADQTQRANDTAWYDLCTAGGAYSIIHAAGGNHLFTNYYDRSNPGTATVWNSGNGRMRFLNGEDQNNTGLSHMITGTGQTILIDRAVTQAGAATTVQISNGSFIIRGASNTNSSQTWALSGSGVIDVSDPAAAVSGATVSGGNGTLMLAGTYAGQGSAPVFGSFGGTVAYPSYTSGGWTSLSPLNGYGNSGSGPNLEFRVLGDAVEITGDVTAPGSGQNTVLATLPSGVNVGKSQFLTVYDRTAGTYGSAAARVQGSPGNINMSGVTANHELSVTGRVYTTA